MSLLAELRRRNVLRVAIAYVAGAWLLIQVVETLFPVFGLSDASIRIIVILLAIGFPLVLIISWIYELTPEGIKLDRDVDRSATVKPHSTRKLDRGIIVVLALAVAYFAADKFAIDRGPDRQAVSTYDRSIAVLPFENLSAQPEGEPFTKGVHDALVTRLMRITDMRVIATTSVRRYRDTEKPLQEIAGELAVANIVEAGVGLDGNTVVVNARLIDGATGARLWAEDFEREYTDFFAIQSDIAAAIVDQLDASLSSAEEERVFGAPTISMEAYNHYMRGRHFLDDRSVEGFEKALQEFEHAVDLDPNFALARVGIADTARYLQFNGTVNRDEYFARRKQAIDKALAIDDQLGEAYISRSTIHWEVGEQRAALDDCETGLELNPSYAHGYVRCGGYLGQLGLANRRLRLDWYIKAGQLDPLSVQIQNLIGAIYVGQGRYSEAQEQFDRVMHMDSEFVPVYSRLSELHGNQGNLAEAIRNLKEALRRDPDNGYYLHRLARAYINFRDFETVQYYRDEMESRLHPDNWRFVGLDLNIALEKNDLDSLPDILKRFSSTDDDSWYLDAVRANTYILLKDFDTARKYWISAEPDWENPLEWDELIGKSQTGNDRLHGCKYAGVLLGLGEEATGKQLLRETSAFESTDLPNYIDDHHRRRGLGWCYLAAGSYEDALTFYEDRIEHGHYADWRMDKHLPWWDDIRDEPRYIAMVARIEEKLNEQRELLRQMDATE